MPARDAVLRPSSSRILPVLLLALAAATASEAGGIPYDPSQYLRVRGAIEAGDGATATAATGLLLAPLPENVWALQLRGACGPEEIRESAPSAAALHPLLAIGDTPSGPGCVRLLFGLFADEASLRSVLPWLPLEAVPPGARVVRLDRDERGDRVALAGDEIDRSVVGSGRRRVPVTPAPPAPPPAPDPESPLPPSLGRVPSAEPPAPPPETPSEPGIPESRSAGEDLAEAQREFVRGKDFLMKRDLEGAAAAFERVVSLDPSNAPAHNNLGTIALLRKNYPLAIAHFENAITIDPDYARARMNMATALYGAGRGEEALGQLDRAAQLSPGEFDIWFNRAALLAEMNRIPEALDALDRALAIQPGDPKALNLQKILDEEMGKRGLARTPPGREAGALGRNPAPALEPAPEIEPPEAAPPAGSASPAVPAPDRGVESGRPVSAPRPMAPPQPASRIPAARPPAPQPSTPPRAPTESDVHFERGRRLYEKGDYRAAISEFEKAIAIDPRNSNAHNNLGAVYLAQARYPTALEEFGKALEIDPGNIRAQVNLGGTLYNLGQVGEAISTLEDARRKAPANPEVLYNLALFYRKAGRDGDAREALEEAVAADPFDPRIRALESSLPQAPEPAWVSEPEVFVREGPGRSFRILAKVRFGEELTVVRREADWVRVRTGEGLEGWVFAELLASQRPAP